MSTLPAPSQASPTTRRPIKPSRAPSIQSVPAARRQQSAGATIRPSWLAGARRARPYRRFRGTIGYVGREVERLGGRNAYEVLDDLVATSPAGSDGLLYTPYLAGSIAPNFDSDARAVFIGLTFSHGTAEMARSVLEGVSYESRDILECFAKMGVELREIRLSAGSTNSPEWCQIHTDIYPTGGQRSPSRRSEDQVGRLCAGCRCQDPPGSSRTCACPRSG